MSKITSSTLASAMATYVDASKQAGAWSGSTNNFVGLLDKVGKIITLDGLFNDYLPELDGDDLPLGKTIEEYFMDLTMPEPYTSLASEGAKDLTPALPVVEDDVVYSYTLGREKVKTTVPYDNFERAMLNSSEAGNLGAKIIERLQNSYDITKVYEKKQLLGNAAEKAYAVADCKVVCDIPVDTETGEAFIETVKELVEDARFAKEGGLEGAFIGAAPSLTLYIKKGIMPNVEVQTLAGAFNSANLAIPCKVKVIEDFGDTTNKAKIFGLLVDDRAVKLHNGYNVIRSKENADGDYINYVKHFEHTGFISKYAYIKVLATA